MCVAMRGNGEKCVAERIPITVIGTFLSLQVHCRDAVLTHSPMGVKLKNFGQIFEVAFKLILHLFLLQP